jgi:predicted nucleic-acid-binding Zn-ribbon protein
MVETERQKEIIAILQERGANLPCPRCGRKNFSLLEEYISLSIQKDLNNIVIGGPSIPSAITICTNCGYISFHAIGALGLLKKNKIEGEANNEHLHSHN